jgi:hypothetical protein
MFGASDQVSDDEVPDPFLHVPSHWRLKPAHAAAALLADSDEQVPIPHVPPRSALVPCDSDDEVLFRALCFLVPPRLPIPLFALARLSRLVAVADA